MLDWGNDMMIDGERKVIIDLFVKIIDKDDLIKIIF